MEMEFLFFFLLLLLNWNVGYYGGRQSGGKYGIEGRPEGTDYVWYQY